MFMLTKNKAYLCRISDHDTWMSRIQAFLDESPLNYAFADWRGRDESRYDSRTGSAGIVRMLLCLDEDGRTGLLPSARDRTLRLIARNWLPPKVGAWLQQRAIQN